VVQVAKMDNEPTYRKAYEELSEELIADLSRVDSPETSQQFIEQATQRITAAHDTLPEFYIGEFYEQFKGLAVKHAGALLDACEHAVRAINTEIEAENRRLNALLEAARATGDRNAEHAVWMERETLQAEKQAKIDEQQQRLYFPRLQIQNCQGLAKRLKLTFTE